MMTVWFDDTAADSFSRLYSKSSADNDMLKTIVIAVCCAVAYLAIVIGLTVYCSIRLMRAKNLRKVNRPTELSAAGAGTRCYWLVKVQEA